jgi:hypothetical protein
MSPENSAWRIAVESFRDIARAWPLFADAYVALYVLNCLQRCIVSYESMNSALMMVLMLLTNLAAVPVYIALVRYFTLGDTTFRYRFESLFWRVVTWCLVIGFAFGAALGFALVLLSAFGTSRPAGLALIVLLFAVTIWGMVRLYTFWPALMIDDKPSIRSSFRETGSMTWLILRALALSALIFGISYLAVGIPFLGLLAAGIVEPSSNSHIIRLAIVLVDSAQITFAAVYSCAFSSRVFLAVRGASRPARVTGD